MTPADSPQQENTAAGLPLVEELPPELTAVEAFRRLLALPHVLFLDSARAHEELGRYSFVAADPFDFLTAGVGRSDPLAQLAEAMPRFATPALPDLPPFQGGAAGLLSYDMCHALERVPRSRFDEFALPAAAIGWYDVVAAFDHVTGHAWLISQGLPEREPALRRQRAQQRLEQFRRRLSKPRQPSQRAFDSLPPPLASARLAPQHAVGHLPKLTSSFSRQEYLAAVERAIEYIAAGDIFQVNLAQRLLYPADDESHALYLRLRERNPATFAGYFNLGDVQIMSASPERLLSVREGEVEARPIKGTRSRTARPEADLFAGDDLRASEKDRAENVMIVDLLRNDLSRACLPESVQVTTLCGLETYETVQHLVSVVRGRLAEGKTALDLVRGAFPGGSITGAPKVRAMEIIAELEPTARGAYCGSLGYFGFDGSLDLSILIRTLTAGRGWWQLPVGGDIVAQSSPAAEYEETWHKAEGMLRALV